jgi:hypothetical protein
MQGKGAAHDTKLTHNPEKETPLNDRYNYVMHLQLVCYSKKIEEKQGVFFIHLFELSTKTSSDEFIVYGSKNSSHKQPTNLVQKNS